MTGYRSDRNVLLIDQTVQDKVVVTLEHWNKWYSIYLLHPNGRVEAVRPGLLRELDDFLPGCNWIDHTFHPNLLLALKEYYDGYVSDIAIEVAAGRWVLEDHGLGDAGYFLNDDVIEKIQAHAKGKPNVSD